MPPCQVRDVFVRRGQALARIDQDDRRIGLLERALRLFDHALVDTDLAAGDTARIDDEIGNGAEFAEAVFPVAGQAGVVGNQRVTGPGEAIE